MKLKERIYKDFVEAFKNRQDRKKSALSMLKAKITESEKANANKELTDTEILKLVVSSVKQRKQSIAEFRSAGREDLVDQETEELSAIEIYLPKQLSEEELRKAVEEIRKSMPHIENKQKMTGMITGAMNKQFPGQFSNSDLQNILL